MKYCKKCLMPDTRPGIKFVKGVCIACIHYENQKKIRWNERKKELKNICEKYKDKNKKDYDCIIAVSGGKDSHYQVYYMKEVMKMNPLLLSVGNMDYTKTGKENLDNLSETFSCDMLIHKPNLNLLKKLSRITFEEYGSPSWYIDALLYSFPIRMATKLGIELVIYGEDVNYTYGGKYDSETPSAKLQSKNDVVKPIEKKLIKKYNVSEKELFSATYPSEKEISKSKINPIYLSYFIPWDSHHNFLVAQKFGFKHLGHEHVREGTLENYNSIDSLTYLLNQFLKYPKFGHASATEMASRWIRSGLKTREEMIPFVKELDNKLDQEIIDNFCKFTNMSKRYFFEVLDKWYNPKLFFKDRDGVWKKKFIVGKGMKQ
ncbi:MAG: N-acetyl sugar amidotransferase [Chloroflexi bacterium]|nr:N-acetyl sugar amidotransferase [Chloroflexota bacterium]